MKGEVQSFSPGQVDADLVQKLKNGDKSAFTSLYKRHYEPLKNFLHAKTKNREWAEDLVQETFLKAREKLPDLREPLHFKTWLYRIGINNFLNSRRQIKDTVQIEEVFLVSNFDLEELTDFVNWKKSIVKFAESLPFRQRQAFILRIFYGYSHAEIAKEMDCPYDTAKANFRHALMKLPKIL